MLRLLEILVGGLSLGLPVWFAYLDGTVFPRLRWVEEGEPPPLWGKMVVVVGVGLAILIALATPLSGFDSMH